MSGSTFDPGIENLSAQQRDSTAADPQGENGQIEVKIANQSNFDLESENSQGGTGPIQASESPKSKS